MIWNMQNEYTSRLQMLLDKLLAAKYFNISISDANVREECMLYALGSQCDLQVCIIIQGRINLKIVVTYFSKTSNMKVYFK